MINYRDIEQHATKIVGKRAVALSFLAIFCLLAFFPTFGNELMDGWDDQWQVVNSYTSGGWNWKNITDIFKYSFHGQYSPLNQLLYICIYSIGEYNPIYYHTTSLLIHILNVWLVYLLIQHITHSTTIWNSERINWMAFGVALVFGIHPLQVETVAWMSASKILLSSLFYLLATYIFILFIERKQNVYYLLTILLFICSYCSKEQAVVFPLWMLLLCYIYGKEINKVTTWKAIAPFFLLALLLGLCFVLETKSVSILDAGSPKDYTWWQRVVFSCYAIIEYICKFLIPYNLQYKYFYPMSPGEPLPTWMLLYPILLAIPIICFWKQLTQKSVLVGLLIFLIHILLVLHIVPINRQHIVADRYIYLSIIGISFVFLLLIFRIVTMRFQIIVAICSILLGTYIIHSNSKTKMWKTTNSIDSQIRYDKPPNIGQIKL